MQNRHSEVKALTFDVFGTVVDWYSSIVAEGEQFGKAHGIGVDWKQFALKWRAGYAPAMNKVRQGELPWQNIDALHRLILDDLLDEFNITDLSEAEKEHLNRAWHRLKPWPDAVSGLERLRQRYIVATLSNGNIALLTNMAKFAGLPWDCILSAELANHYKPDHEVYQTAATLLGLSPNEVMMVSAHPGELQAAQTVGFQTALVPRPLEYGHGSVQEVTAHTSALVAEDFNALANALQRNDKKSG